MQKEVKVKNPKFSIRHCCSASGAVYMEGLKVADANLTVYVHPSKSKRVSQAILQELSSLLFRYHEIFDGVVLAYDVEVSDKTAKILPGIHPYFNVKLKANLLLFSPKPDMLIEGKVVKLTQESIHVIVLGFASAAIIDEDIRKEFKFKTKNGKEEYRSRSDKHHVIKVGSMIRFQVKRLDEEILHIAGSLLPDQTGNIQWLDKNSEEAPIDERNHKKRRHIQQAGEEQTANNGDKKSKKRRVTELA